MQNDIIRPPTPSRRPPPSTSEAADSSEVHAQPATPDQSAQPSPDIRPSLPAEPSTPIALAKSSDLPPEPAAPLAQKPKNKLPIGVIAAAVVVFLALASGVVYMTLRGKEDAKQAVSTTQTPAPTTPATDTSSDINDALNEAAQLPTSGEDPTSDLSDQTLGL